MRLVSFSTLFVIGTDTLLTAPLLPLLSKEFNTSTEQSGWFVSAYALGYAVFALIAGPLSDRIDRRRIILTGSIGFTLFTGLCGLAWGVLVSFYRPVSCGSVRFSDLTADLGLYPHDSAETSHY